MTTMTTKTTSLYLLLAIVTSMGAFAQPLASSQIDKLVARTMETFDVPGMAVAVLKDGEVVHMKGHGVRSLETGEAMDKHTLFGIASNSKAFTAAALGILVDQGKITWDDRVIDHIPEFILYDPYVTHDFRIRDLLCHRSGMGLGAGDLMIWPDGTDFSRQDVIHNLRHLKQVSSFRTKYDYDNLLYIVAGEVIAKVSGLSWEEFIEQKILHPVGMKKSAASYIRLKDKSNVIAPPGRVHGKVQVIERTTNELMNAAGGIYSSVAEMANWASLLLNTYNHHNKTTAPLSGARQHDKLLSRKQLNELWSPQTIIPVRNPGAYNTHFAAYGLGFRLADEMGSKVISHTGGLAGMVTKMTLIPELDLAIIVLTNQQVGAAFTVITNEIKDGYFHMNDPDWLNIYAKAAQANQSNANKQVEAILAELKNPITQNPEPKTQNPESKTQNPAPNIIGTYKDPWLGNITIFQKNDQLRFLSERSPGLDGQVYWYKGTSFVVKWDDRSMDADAFMRFELDFDGLPSGFTMKAISPMTDFSYDFHDLDFKRIK